MAYVCNHTRLNLEETGFGSDVPLEVLQADVAKTGFTGYVAPEFVAAAKPGPAQPASGGTAPAPPATGKGR